MPEILITMVVAKQRKMDYKLKYVIKEQFEVDNVNKN
jgi:hypothetical protein